MSLASSSSSPSSSRGEIILQPAYFTSSAFVHAARADVDCLIQEFSQAYTRSAHSRDRPFALFKETWQRLGWTWIQFKVFDARSRAAFLRVVMRLFLERIGDGETPLGRVAALFGLYTMLRTQPSTTARSLYSAAQAEVTCDMYQEILTLPDALDDVFLHAIRPHVVYVQSSLLESDAFQILPRAETCPLSPRALPREVVVMGTAAAVVGAKRRGRPPRGARTRETLAALERECRDGDEDVLGGTRAGYMRVRSALVDAVGGDERWERARAAVAEQPQDD